MKIAVVVHGRFHAFDLALALIRRGHQVTVFTNYPAWAAEGFGLPRESVRGFWAHGVVGRVSHGLRHMLRGLSRAPALHRMFGRWAADEVAKQSWDVLHAFSGVAKELLERTPRSAYGQLVRGSAHIRVQDRLLAEEEERTGCAIERPAAWMIEREEAEYELTDAIVTPSRFAYDSFVEQGVDAAKLRLLPLGVDVSRFRPDRAVVAERCRRIRAGDPLRVLFVGVLSYQKGLHDLVRVVEALRRERVRFRFVGSIPRESRRIVRRIEDYVEFIPHQRQSSLPQWYAQSDVFFFPTIQDGFAVVLSQANASALPILTTTNCAGPDFLEPGKTGWTLPIRQPHALIDRLLWCDQHRAELADMVDHSYRQFQPRDWSSVAQDFETICARRTDLAMRS